MLALWVMANDRQVTIALSQEEVETIDRLAGSQKRKRSPMIRLLIQERLAQLEAPAKKRRAS